MAAVHDEGSYLAALAAVESLLAKDGPESDVDPAPDSGQDHGTPGSRPAGS